SGPTAGSTRSASRPERTSLRRAVAGRPPRPYLSHHTSGRPTGTATMIAEEDDSMRRATIITACFSALLVSVAAAPVFAGYGAVALDESAGRYGFGWNEDTQKRADETALQ